MGWPYVASVPTGCLPSISWPACFARATWTTFACSALSDETGRHRHHIQLVPALDSFRAMIDGLCPYRFASLDTGGAPDIDANAWLVGGGIEAMLTDNWFIGVEGIAALGEPTTTLPASRVSKWRRRITAVR